MSELPGPAVVLLVLPLLAGLLCLLSPSWKLAAGINIVSSSGMLAAAMAMWRAGPSEGEYLLVDDLSTLIVMLTTFVGFTTSLFSHRYMQFEMARERLSAAQARFYHAMYQALMFGMLLALLTNNIGVMWVAIELATLATISIVGIYRTAEGLEAAWKYFILGSVGIGLALFGTILVYVAAEPAIGEGYRAMVWSVLTENAAAMNPRILDVAFVFLLLGYGTKLGLVPVHGWLPDAHAEGPTPVTAVLSGLMLNVALYAVLRFRTVLMLNGESIAPGPLLATLGLVSLFFGAFMLFRRDDIKRFFAYSSVEHMGIAVLAFGIGGTLANVAGLLHMLMHCITKSAVFFSVGHLTQVRGTQKISAIHGLTASNPLPGWLFVASVAAIAGLPPFGLFMSEFLLLNAALAFHPGLAILLALGLLVAFVALFLRLGGLAFGDPVGPVAQARLAIVPIGLHLLLVVAAGMFLPEPLFAWLQRIARVLG